MKSSFGCFIAALLVFWIPVAFWTDRSLDYWLTFAKGAPVDVPFWISLIVALVIEPIVIAFNIITELLRFVI